MFRLNYMRQLVNSLVINSKKYTARQIMSGNNKKTVESPKNNGQNHHIVWVDLEMTGLDIEKDRIIEMACLITDKDLNIVAEGPDLVINQPDELLDGMDDWCKKTHGESGLTQAVRDSKIDIKEAERQMLAFLHENKIPAGKCPLAGNSVHVDRMFLNKQMSRFLEHLHYRIIDVSSLKELGKRWYPEMHHYNKKNPHRALEDIRESVGELKFYRSNMFK